jgi:hypothetical protein
MTVATATLGSSPFHHPHAVAATPWIQFPFHLYLDLGQKMRIFGMVAFEDKVHLFEPLLR